MNWVSLIIGSILIYFIFVFLGDYFYVLGFKSFKTANASFTSIHFYLLTGLIIVVVYLFDSLVLILKKEFSKPLSYTFNSIMRRGKEYDKSLFELAATNYHKDNWRDVQESIID